MNREDPTGQTAKVDTLPVNYDTQQQLVDILPYIVSEITLAIKAIKIAIKCSWIKLICIAAVTVAAFSLFNLIRVARELTKNAKKVIKETYRLAKNKNRKTNGYSVYVIMERKRKPRIVYVGMTKNFDNRRKSHFGTRGMFKNDKHEMIAVFTGLSRIKARVTEQILISSFTLENLNNLINSIAPSKWDNLKSNFDATITMIMCQADPE